MDRNLARLDTIEAQRLRDLSQEHLRQRYIRIIKHGILYTLRSLGFLQPEGDIESVPSFLFNLRFSDILDFPGEYVPMNPEIFTAVSSGKRECMEILRSHGKPMACLKSNQGDSVLHLAAACGRLALVKSIVSECPCLLLEPNSKDQLPLHVAAHAGHLDVVKVLVASVTYFSTILLEEGRGRLNPYVVKDRDGDTPLHLALKGRNLDTSICLVNSNQGASFLADKSGISPLYMAVGAGIKSLVKAMLNNIDIDGLDSQLEGRRCLVHAALKASTTAVLDVILQEYPNLENERDGEGRSCLSLAASIGNYRGVRKLLSQSTKSVYVCDNDGSFPIHVAVEKRHMSVVREILRRCPDSVYLLNKQGQTILHIAAKNGNIVGFFFRQIPLTWKQDVKGNTPLHLATMNWRPRTIFYLLFHTQEFLLPNPYANFLNIRNNSGLTALDIAKSNVQPNYIFLERVTLMVLLYFYPPESKGGYLWMILMRFLKKTTKRSDPPAGERNKDYVNTLLVVAALVATVTFAAGFTIPGGFNSSAPNLGKAIFANDTKLVMFMVFDTLAMQSSIVTIATLIWAQLGDPSLVQKSLNVALPSLFFALLCMLVAFYCGVFGVFAHVKAFSIFLNVTSAIILFQMIFILGPHVILQIPGIPAIFGLYFIFFVMLVDENGYEQASPVRMTEQESTEDSNGEASPANVSVQQST